jgi:hypothetical protein
MKSNNFQDMVEEIVNKLDDEQKEHLQFLITKLLFCYSKESPHAAIIIFGNNEDGTIALASANANQFECAQLLYKAHDYTQKMMLADAPPKEMFN